MEQFLNSDSFYVFKSLINFFWPLPALGILLFVLLAYLFEKKILIHNSGNVGSSSEDKGIIDLNDKPSNGINIISFFIPLVGLIIYLIEREKSPIKATSAGKAALWGVGVTIVLSIISFFLMFSFISSIN